MTLENPGGERKILDVTPWTPHEEHTAQPETTTSRLSPLQQVREAQMSVWRLRHHYVSEASAATGRMRVDVAFTGISTEGAVPATSSEAITSFSHSRAEEYRLFQALERNYPAIKEIRLAHLPAELFAVPDSNRSYNTAKTAVGSESLLEHFLNGSSEIVCDVCPFLEKVLIAYENYLEQQAFLSFGASPEAYKAHQAAWLASEVGERSMRTDTYQELADNFDRTTLSNGVNEVVAHSVIYGSPGTGKTEFIVRYIRERLKKKAIVVSVRPYLSYDELVAGVQIMPGLSGSSPERTIRETAPEIVFRGVIAKAQKVAQESSAQQSATAASFSEENDQQAVFGIAYLLHIGLSQETAQSLKDYITSTGNSTAGIDRNGGHVPSALAQKVKDELLQQSVERALPNGSQDDAQQEYIRGILLAADLAGACVVLDEAEKLYGSADSSNQSFAGLENFLNLKPGSTLTFGKMSHTLQNDFRVFMTMNTPTVPEHVLSRFKDSIYRLEDSAIDRLQIIFARTSNLDGNCVLSPEMQQKLAFLATTAWDTFSQAAHERKMPWDLRTLNAILSALVIRDSETSIVRASGETFASACSSIQRSFPEVWGAFPPLENISLGFEDFMAGEEEVGEEEDSPDFILQSTRAIPGAEYSRRGWKRRLQTAEIAQLQEIHLAEQSLRPPRVPVTANVSVLGNMITLSTAGVSEVKTTLLDPNDSYAASDKVASSSWGDRVLLHLKGTKNYLLYQTNRAQLQDEPAEVLLTVESTQEPVLTADGTTLITSSSDGSITLYACESNKEFMEVRAKTEGKPNTSTSVSATPDGKYLIITRRGNETTTQVLDITRSVAARTPQYVTKPLRGEWTGVSHKEHLFIWNTSGQGMCLN